MKYVSGSARGINAAHAVSQLGARLGLLILVAYPNWLAEPGQVPIKEKSKPLYRLHRDKDSSYVTSSLAAVHYILT
jgi:hypothetical protein